MFLFPVLPSFSSSWPKRWKNRRKKHIFRSSFCLLLLPASCFLQTKGGSRRGRTRRKKYIFCSSFCLLLLSASCFLQAKGGGRRRNSRKSRGLGDPGERSIFSAPPSSSSLLLAQRRHEEEAGGGAEEHFSQTNTQNNNDHSTQYTEMIRLIKFKNIFSRTGQSQGMLYRYCRDTFIT